MLQVYRERAPLRRGVEQSEVADAAVFLLGPASRAVTGEVVMVDAGYPRHRRRDASRPFLDPNTAPA